MTKKKASSDCILTSAGNIGRTEYPDFQYYQIDENWQLQTCNRLGLQYIQGFTVYKKSFEVKKFHVFCDFITSAKVLT